MAERTTSARAESRRWGGPSLDTLAALTAAAFVLLIVAGVLPRLFW
jgi:hypothetical protein